MDSILPHPPKHLLLGKHGEQIAERFLLSRGYQIRGRNIRLGRDEIDLLAFDPVDQVLVFVEVKTRAHMDENFPPEMNAGFRKRKKLRRSARKWVASHKYNGSYRIDLVTVAGNRIIDHFRELDWDE